MSLPDHVRKELRTRVWREAEALGWFYLPSPAKSRQYDNWAKDPQIGGIIERYLDRRQVRAYLKDTLLKRYSAGLKASPDRPLQLLGLNSDTPGDEDYVKPHGRRLDDGRIIVWGKSSEWKSVLTALHERAYEQPGWTAYAAVFFDARGRFGERRTRAMIEDAAHKLKITRVIWVEM